jgi:drug/metabolite transporter (DMT)-like permease
MTIETSSLPLRPTFDLVTVGALVATILGWASAFPAIRAGLTAFGPLELGSLRFTIAAVPAAILLLVLRPTLPSKAEFARLALGGFIFVATYTVVLNIGEKTVAAGPASFIVNVSPIITALLAMTLLGEKFGLRAWAGTALSFIGIGLVATGDGSRFEINVGALFILMAAVCTALDPIVRKPLFARHKPLVVSAWTMLFGALFLAPGLPHGIAQFAQAAPDARFAAVYLGIVPSFIAYATWTITIARFPASRAANFLYCVPPTATLMGFLWLGETPALLGIVGGFMALTGVAIVNLRRR